MPNQPTPEQMQAMQAIQGVPAPQAFNFAPPPGGDMAQIIGMMGLAPAVTQAGDAASGLWQGLFGDPRVTQASVPDPKQAMARMVQLVKHMGKTGVRGSKVTPNLERNMQVMLQGQQGEKGVLEIGDELVDLINVGVPQGKKAGTQFWKSIDDFVQILSKNLRRGGPKTPKSELSKQSLKRAEKGGHLVYSPEHEGYLSTAHPLGKSLLEQQAQGIMDPDLMNFIKTVGGQ